MAVTFYSWEDAGAPQFTTSGQSVGTNNIIEILDAVLITGYGSKQGLGWSKVASSTINDRTVYRNQSAYQNNMHLMVQSNPTYANSILWQIADSVTSPEDYYGYSSVASTGNSYGINRWWAMGDERTMVFAVGSNNMDGSHFYVYWPNILYVGDFDSQGNENPNSWGLLAQIMTLGTLDTVTASGATYGALNTVSHRPQKYARPLTTMPGQEWAESNITFCCSSFMMGENISAYWPSKVSGYQDVDEFLTKASIRSPWYIYLDNKWFYRLRGTYSITPELFFFNKTTTSPNAFKPFTLDGNDYIVSGVWSGLCFQTSGDW